MWSEVLNRAILSLFDQARLFIAGLVIDSVLSPLSSGHVLKYFVMFSANIFEIFVSTLLFYFDRNSSI